MLTQRIKAILRPLVNAWRRQRRQADLRRSVPMVTAARLTADLDALPIRDGAVVLVHSSLKRLGFVEGGAASAAAALVASIVQRRGGTLLVPTFSIDGNMYRTLASGRPFDVRTTPSNLGAIPEQVRRHPDALRSVHPSHSFAAIGPRAAWLVGDHHRAGSNFGRDTPMGRLLEADGTLLGLGSDIGHVTFTHVQEDMESDFAPEVYAADGPFAVDCTDAEGVTHRLLLHAHAPGALPLRRIDHPDNGFLRDFFQEYFEQHSGLTWHRVGEASCWLIGAAPMYQAFRTLAGQGITIYSRREELGRAG